MSDKRITTCRFQEAILRRLMGTVTHVLTETPVAALTFDDGPHPEFTARMLDILEKHQAKATFFLVGRAAQKHPEIVQRMGPAVHNIETGIVSRMWTG